MKYKFQVMVALTYEDKDVEVEVELSDEEVARMKELIGEVRNDEENDEDSYQSPQDLLQILEADAPELFEKFWEVIMPPVFVEMLINGFDNGCIEKDRKDEYDDYHDANFDEIYDMYGEDIEMEHSSCCICKIPKEWFS